MAVSNLRARLTGEETAFAEELAAASAAGWKVEHREIQSQRIGPRMKWCVSANPRFGAHGETQWSELATALEFIQRSSGQGQLL